MIDNFNVVVGDVDISIDILREVAQWCEDNRMNMWKVSDLTKERLIVGVNKDNFCVGKIGEDNACSMILQWYDPLFWPEAKENDAGYIHKLCVRRKYSGKGLSAKMVEFAVAECKKRGIRYLRLDTGWSRKPLCKLYESFGFRRVGKRILGEREFALYELEIGGIVMADYIGDLRKLIGTRPIIMCGANVILLNNQDQILLHHRTDRDWWGLPGGAMELGESLEQTASREVLEEVGLICKDLKLFNVYSGEKLYYKYPDGNEVYNVTATYICKDYSGEIVVDTTEGRDARFFSLDEIPPNLSYTIKGIVEEFLLKYHDLKVRSVF